KRDVGDRPVEHCHRQREPDRRRRPVAARDWKTVLVDFGTHGFPRERTMAAMDATAVALLPSVLSVIHAPMSGGLSAADATLLFIIGGGDDSDRITQAGSKIIVTGTS